MSNVLQNIRIVLVHTTHPGNIGAVARAMKTMCLQNLYLVQPKQFPDPVATARAKQAEDILANAKVVATLPEAIADCCLVLGTSARSRTLTWPTMNVAEARAQIIAEAGQHPVAIVFGRERTGLTNEEIQLCHYQLNIPANPDYSSLNLAAAVQVVVYELYQQYLNQPTSSIHHTHDKLATMAEVVGFYEHLERVLAEINFVDPSRPGQIMSRLQRLYGRARLDKVEINILRGMLKAMQKKLV